MIFMMKLKIKLRVVFHLKMETRLKNFLLFILIIQDSLYSFGRCYKCILIVLHKCSANQK